MKEPLIFCSYQAKEIFMKLGLIGTGIIGEAFIRGLLTKGTFEGDVFVSTRSESRSTRLAKDFNQVSVFEQNQDIVNQSEIVILAVLPEQVEDVIRGLTFRADQILLSIVSSITLKSLADWAHPCEKIFRGIPLPPIEKGIGPFPICPPAPELESLLSKVGTVVSLENEDQFLSVAVGSAMMAMFYEVVATTASYMEETGLPATSAAQYASSMMHALADSTLDADPAELQSLSETCLTPGGLNEQVLFGLRKSGWYDSLRGEMDGIKNRLSKY